MKNRSILVLALAILLSFVLGACGGKKASAGEESKENTGSTKGTEESKSGDDKAKNAGDPLVVSTMNDIEVNILGSMMVLALRDAGYEIEDNVFGYVGTVNGRTALIQGETDLYLEYTGRGMSLIEGVDMKLYRDLKTAYDTTSKWDEENNGIVWLNYAPINNTNAIAVTKEFSEKHNMKTMDDFAKYVNSGGEVKLMAQDYWVTLESGLHGMEKAYGFVLDKDQYIVTEAGANNEQLLHEGTDGVNFAMVYSTSGACYAYEQVILEDPKHVSPVYSPAPVLKKETLEKYPEIKDILNPIFDSITQAEMLEMNSMLQVDGKSGKEVAEQYLIKKGFLKADGE